jgi:aspartyl-tRNA(Asn)/glutamyl-tRNA(Gln) amidotransferase subunit A
MTHPADLSATDLLGLYRKKALSPIEAVDAVLDRIASLKPVFNVFRLVDADVARAQAR